MHGLAETFLIADIGGEAIEIAPGLFFDPRPPKFGKLLRMFRRLEAGQPFAHDQSDRFFKRRLGALLHIGEMRALAAVIEHGIEILRHALHARRADGFDARLFHRLENRARIGHLRQHFAMQIGIVTGKPQGHGIGMAAQNGGLARIEFARRLGQPRFGRVAGARQIGLFRRIGDFEIGHMRERAHAGSDRALKGLLRRFDFRRRLLV